MDSRRSTPYGGDWDLPLSRICKGNSRTSAIATALGERADSVDKADGCTVDLRLLWQEMLREMVVQVLFHVTRGIEEHQMRKHDCAAKICIFNGALIELKRLS